MSNLDHDLYDGREPDDRTDLITAVNLMLQQIEWVKGMKFYVDFFKELPEDFHSNLNRMEFDLTNAKNYLDTYIRKVDQ